MYEVDLMMAVKRVVEWEITPHMMGDPKGTYSEGISWIADN
jgi:hypothetical protein